MRHCFRPAAALAMSTGELMGLPVLGLGVWYAVARGRRAAGTVIALAGAAWTFVAVYVFVRVFSGGDSVFYGFYDQVGGSPQGVVRTLVDDPGAIVSAKLVSTRSRRPSPSRSASEKPWYATALNTSDPGRGSTNPSSPPRKSTVR